MPLSSTSRATSPRRRRNGARRAGQVLVETAVVALVMVGAILAFLRLAHAARSRIAADRLAHAAVWLSGAGGSDAVESRLRGALTAAGLAPAGADAIACNRGDGVLTCTVQTTGASLARGEGLLRQLNTAVVPSPWTPAVALSTRYEVWP